MLHNSDELLQDWPLLQNARLIEVYLSAYCEKWIGHGYSSTITFFFKMIRCQKCWHNMRVTIFGPNVKLRLQKSVAN